MKNGHKVRAFTLIEIMAAMAVLMILVLLVARLFRDSAATWALGTRRAEANMESRAILDFMAVDLQSAAADEFLGFRLESEDSLVFGTTKDGVNAGWNNDALWFVSLANDPASGTNGARAARQVKYYVERMEPRTGLGAPMEGRYRLMRVVKTGDIDCYELDGTNHVEFWQTMSDVGEETIAENVASFEVWCWGVESRPGGMIYTNRPDFNTPSDPSLVSPYSYQTVRRDSEFHRLPVYVEILFTKLSEADAIKAADLYIAARSAGGPYTSVQAFVNQHAIRHVIRVNMMNANGYGRGR